jgi:hypothetical protein
MRKICSDNRDHLCCWQGTSGRRNVGHSLQINTAQGELEQGRSPDWIKSKNPEAPAVKREAEEEWGR